MDDGCSPIYGIAAAVITLVLYGGFYGFSAALDNISENEAQEYGKNRKKRWVFIQKLLDDRSIFESTKKVITVMMGLFCGYMILSCLVQPVYTRFLQMGASAYITKTGLRIVTAFLMLLILGGFLMQIGILIPELICSIYPLQSAFFLAGMLQKILCVFLPLVKVLQLFTRGIVKLFGMDPDSVDDDVTEEELKDMLDEAHEQGVLMESEAAMIQNIIEFSDKSAKDIMTHRMNIQALDGSMTLKDAVDMVLSTNKTRFPVYEGDLDNIIGIVHMKDIMIKFTANNRGRTALRNIPNLIRTVSIIPETRGIDALFKAMQAKKAHMAIVVDEYGQTSGLVTMEDILEEIVGNIFDEYDETERFIVPLQDNSIMMEGLTRLDEVEKVLQVSLHNEEFETLNGYLTSKLEHIPGKEDKEVITDGYRFQILAVHNNVIQKVKVIKLQEEEKGE